MALQKIKTPTTEEFPVETNALEVSTSLPSKPNAGSIVFSDEQRAVKNHRRGHALVSAVAGSGKTEVLVARVVAMLEEGYDPERMLVLMFNKSAQEVFLKRLTDQYDGALPEVKTFHALGLYILNLWQSEKGLEPILVIEDSLRWLDLMRSTADHLNLHYSVGINTHTDYLKKLLVAVDTLKNLDYPNVDVNRSLVDWSDSFWEHLQLVFPIFEQFRKKQNIVGLNDLLYQAVSLLRNDAEYAKAFRYSIDHILIDEYQDSNPLQHWIVKCLTHADSSIMVVGDEDQCIYTWRAADPDMMVQGFEAQYPNVTRYTLSKTFRYGHAIALMANHVLQHNKQRPNKMVVSGTNEVGSVRVFDNDVIAALEEALPLLSSEDAILVREFSHAGDVEWVARMLNIPYRLEGALPFPKRRHGLALRCCLERAISGDSNFKPPYETAVSWIRWVDPESSSVFVDILAANMQDIGIENAVRKAMLNQGLSTRQQNHLVQLLVWNGRLGDVATQDDAFESLVRRLREAWCRSVEKVSDRPKIPGFVRALRFIEDYSLEAVLDLLDTWPSCEAGVLLTSIHRAKGGGWNTVLLAHTEAGMFPSEISEEERRLFYVAITRAKKSLLLCVGEDPLRDALWSDPVRADLQSYKGSTGRFVLESFPLYCLSLCDQWFNKKVFGSALLTSPSRQYEAIMFPQQTKSGSALSKFAALVKKAP